MLREAEYHAGINYQLLFCYPYITSLFI